MLAIIVFMIFITAMIVFQALLNMLYAPQMRLQERMESLDESVQSYDFREEEMADSLSNRLFGPAVEGFGKFMIKFSPKSKRDRLELLLKQSGKIEKTSVGKWYMKN